MSVTTGAAGGCAVVTVVGELDLHTAPRLREALLPLAEEAGASVVVDLTEVPFLDSSGLTVFVVALKRLREQGGSLRLVAPSPRVVKVFAITGLDAAIPIHADLAAALADSG